MKWDKESEWYPACEDEMLRFTGSNESTHDDQFDAFSLLAIGFDKMVSTEEEDFSDSLEESPEDLWYSSRHPSGGSSGRSAVTGY